jgi:ABC-type dipeptide/oligopeptide/nickel transport system permease subunit
MTPVVQLYWIRVVLGIVAGAITAFIAAYFGGKAGMADTTTLVNSITVALLIYFVTYYILRASFKNKIEKQSKILSTAIGMYFFSWITFFVLFYTVFALALGLPLTE